MNSANAFSSFSFETKMSQWRFSSRIEITKELVAKAGLEIFEVQVQGKSSLAKMLSTVCVGDFTSDLLGVSAWGRPNTC